MPINSAGLTTRVFAVFAKDLRLELRSRYALNTILMFGVTTLAIVSFSLGQSGLATNVLASLFWIIMFFSATAALAQVFVREEESGTALVLRLVADPNAVYIGKLAFNLALMTALAIVIAPLFFVFTDAPTGNISMFVLILVLGIISLCGATTLVAAIISRAAVRGTLFAVLSFPILILPLMMLVTATDSALAGGAFETISAPVQGLTAYSVIMITVSILLFQFVWKE